VFAAEGTFVLPHQSAQLARRLKIVLVKTSRGITSVGSNTERKK
jgi:hypothetical protein